jgi:hypothetical protein
MDKTTRSELPGRLEGVRRRFEQWRRTRTVGSRIPDRLWASAATAAVKYGIFRTAKALGLNHATLKKHIPSQTTASASMSKDGVASQGRPFMDGARSMPAFVELTSFAPSGTCECLLEWEDAGGAKMRVRLQGVGIPDLAALGRSFWDRQS